MSDDDHIRIGNPEREHVVRLLNDAFAAGYLDTDEFSERSGEAYAARTRGDLQPLLADLPNGQALFGPTPTGSGPSTPGQAPVAQPVDIAWETVKRKGQWRVPAAMSVSGSMGTLILDFSRARFDTLMTVVDLQVSVGTVKITLGRDHEIRYTGLTKTGWSTIKDKAGPPAARGGHVITLSGTVSAASNVVIKRR